MELKQLPNLELLYKTGISAFFANENELIKALFSAYRIKSKSILKVCSYFNLINIKKKYAFDKPVSEQYLLYLNDLSPLSIHSKNIDDYTFLVKNKYNHKTIFQTNSSVFVIKFPYLRTSFTKQGKLVSQVLKETMLLQLRVQLKY